MEPINSEEETESVGREWQNILKYIQKDIEADIPDFEYSDDDCSMMDDDCNTIRDGGADDDQHEQPMQQQPPPIPPPMTAPSPIAQPQQVIQQVGNQNVAGAAATATKPYAVEPRCTNVLYITFHYLVK